MRGLGVLTLALLVLAAPMASALPTPGFFGEEAREVTGRLFPEALETNDYVGIFEGIELLEQLANENPDYIDFHVIGPSAGWDTPDGGHDELPVMAVTITNKQATQVPLDKRINVLYMLSIHGNEKGGREGGFRVIEDFALATQTGEDVGVATQERVGFLDFMRLILLFPNPDGWAHEELDYRADNPNYFGVGPVETQNFVRVNGNGVDLNRQTPTQGWSRASGSHEALSQPESRAYVPWLTTTFTKIHWASDIHGMLYPANALVNSSRPIQCVDTGMVPEDVPGVGGLTGQEQVCLREGNFVLSMLPAAQMTPREEVQTTGLAELLRERMNADPYFAEYQSLPGLGVWGGEYNDWGTVWDTIGYVDSGFSSDFFAQDTGLDAPGVNFELSYNHVMFDNYYPGLGQRINDYHVHTVRIIVGTFMDMAALGTQVTIDTQGTSTAYIPTRVVATNVDDEEPLTGWAAENEYDDRWDYEGQSFTATVNDYFTEMAPFLANGDLPGTLAAIEPEEVNRGFDAYDNVVVPGSAAQPILDQPARIETLTTFVRNGGTLVLTDEALQLLGAMGVLDPSAIDVSPAYAGYTNWENREHALADGVRGLARQFYEPMPLGFQEGFTSPVWSIDRASFEDAGGETVGVLGPNRANLGEIGVGDGRVVVIGALLPDPTEEYYHPYGLASYATTYTGNQVFRNALGWQLHFETPPRVTEAGVILPSDDDERPDPTSSGATGGGEEESIPAVGLLPLAALLAAAAVALRRRHRP